ncbi:MAG: glycoside hydrolase [Bacteroidota bacterium]
MRAIITALCFLLFMQVTAQDVYQGQRENWLRKAEQLKPALVETIKQPQQLVSVVKDENAFQGWKAEAKGSIKELYETSFKSQSGTIVDFGEHITGHFTFSLQAIRGVSDAPTRLKFTFGEVPSEVAVPFDPYDGALSRGWLQDEIINVMETPATITLPRRMSFRYVKIELLGSSRYFDFALTSMSCRATTSAATTPEPLASTTDKLISDIDRVGLTTLKECMQTVYEDGPKRDRRLWIGDLYLESIANVYSFKNHNLTKRCLYLLAALSSENGFLNSNVFETPTPHPQIGAPFLFDYSLLYNASLKEYVVATKDFETANDLWPLAKKQLENTTRFLTPEGLFDHTAATAARWWLFIDWKDGLDRQAPIHGVIIYGLKQTYELAKLLGKEKELAHVPAQIKKLTEAARKHLYDKKSGVFTSGSDKQVSYASQAWMILSGVATPAEGQRAIQAVLQMPDVTKQGAPYLYHYFIEAMIQCGLPKEAREAVVTYWGDMVKKGADTFWEVYDPTNDLLSPYNFYPVNSYCHAWSCTPVYFIRKYPEIFQR